MTDNNESAPEAPPKREMIRVEDTSQYANLLDTAKFEHLYRVATAFASSEMVPVHFQGKVANCLVALHVAFRLQMDPFMALQKMYVVAGKVGLEAQLIIALARRAGVFKDPIDWRTIGEGDNREWTAYTILAATGKPIEFTLTMEMVRAEGWLGKQGSKWKTMPDLMGRYRSAVMLIRLYAPEVILGLETTEEIRDVIDVTPRPPGPVEAEEKPASPTEAVAKKLLKKAPPPPPEPEPEPEFEFAPPSPTRDKTQAMIDQLKNCQNKDALVDVYTSDNFNKTKKTLPLDHQKAISDAYADKVLEFDKGKRRPKNKDE